MFSSDQYELIDFGQGRKLERFGDLVLDRPAAAADHAVRSDSRLWRSAEARFVRQSASQGKWQAGKGQPDCWVVRHDKAHFQLQRTPSGAVGLFPEQAENWDWLRTRIARAARPLTVLNLFAYTGGSTLAAAAAGAEVVHVDAARSVVSWARRNAELSGLQQAPIRWIVEDVRKFVDREQRRGRQYDAVILDPPTYGHGPKSEPWKLHEHLYDLLQGCAQLTRQRRAFMLLTCHGPGIGAPELEAMLADTVFGHCQSGVVAKRLTLSARDGRRLSSGVVGRWPS